MLAAPSGDDLLGPDSPEAEALLRAELSARLVDRGDGLSFPDQPTQSALIWWERQR